MRFLFFTAASAVALVEEKNRPVTKVIELLKGMQKTLEKEQEEDQEVYQEMQCWCTTNDKEKTEAIKEAEVTIEQLGSRIEELTAQSARLNVEILHLHEEIAENQESLESAIKIREKERTEFEKQEKDMIQAIQTLKTAITVLQRHHPSLIQQSDLVMLASKIHHTINEFPNEFALSVSPSKRRILDEFLQAPGYQSYNARSGEIFGILKQMLENFETDLKTSQADEVQKATVFAQLKQSKEQQIEAGQARADNKTQEKADADNSNSEAKQQLDDTRNTLSADEQFLMNLKQKCALTDKEWESRQKTRQEEIVAVGEAIKILAADDANDTFSKTFNKKSLFFLQVTNNRKEAADVISTTGKKFNNLAMVFLATLVKSDSFKKVKDAIDKLILEIKKQKEDDIKHQDWCMASERENESLTTQKGRDKTDTESLLETSKVKLSTLEERIKQLKSEIAEIEVQIKHAGEDREKANKGFQQTIRDQRDTQRLLARAVEVLQRVYAKKGKSFIQSSQEPAGPPPPGGFKEYSQNQASAGVLNLLEQIIEDAKAMEAQAQQDEKDAQIAYEQLVNQNTVSIEEKQKAKTNDESAKADVEGELIEQKQGVESINTELQQLSESKMNIDKACMFINKNFEIRQKAQDEEVEALIEAKAILSGAKFGPSTGGESLKFLQVK